MTARLWRRKDRSGYAWATHEQVVAGQLKMMPQAPVATLTLFVTGDVKVDKRVRRAAIDELRKRLDRPKKPS